MISFPLRFEKQVRFLESHPRCGMVGTWTSIWVQDKPTERVHRHPADDLDIKFDLLFDNPFVHSSVMIRKAAIEKVGLYTTDKTRQPPEDYELWSRIAENSRWQTFLKCCTYTGRCREMSRIGPSPFLDRVVDISAENLAWYAARGKVDSRP